MEPVLISGKMIAAKPETLLYSVYKNMVAVILKQFEKCNVMQEFGWTLKIKPP